MLYSWIWLMLLGQYHIVFYQRPLIISESQVVTVCGIQELRDTQKIAGVLFHKRKKLQSSEDPKQKLSQ